MKLCPKKNCKRKAQNHPVFGVIPCKIHLQQDTDKAKQIRNAPLFNHPDQADRIMGQRDHALGAIAQPWMPDGKPNETFIKSNPREVVEEYFTNEELEAL